MRLRYKIMLALITIAMGICFMTLQSYALWVARYESGENIAEIGCYSINFLENQGPISLNNTYPMSDAKALSSGIYYSFTVTNTCTTDSSYAVTINPLNTNTLTKDKIKYAIYKSSEGRPTTGINLGTVTDVNEDLSAYPNASSISESLIVATGSLKGATSSTANDGQSVTYILYLWMDENDTLADANKTFEASVYVSNYASKIGPTQSTLTKLQSLNPSIAVLDSTPLNPDFSKIAPSDTYGQTSGLFASEDDYGDSYYFRGMIDNNYVSFGNILWRIIRINGDGSLRLITDQSVGNSAFNTLANDNTYMGYMYGETDGSTYEVTHANTHDSLIKTYLDNWYQTNLTSVSSYITDTLFCNDRSGGSAAGVDFASSHYGYTYTSLGYGKEITLYGAESRFIEELDLAQGNKATLKCPNKHDAFTVSDTVHGNGDLTYPIGLITADEVNMAGFTWEENNNLYLNTGSYYWTMSPTDYDSNNAGVRSVLKGGHPYHAVNQTNVAVRPVINIKADYITSGTGTLSTPFSAS